MMFRRSIFSTVLLCSICLSALCEWSESHIHLSHAWDCNGLDCDFQTIDGDLNRYIPAHGYAPQDPENHGGSMYGERLWLVGHASDALTDMLGDSDPCCGMDSTSGCGKCILVQNPEAEQKDWTAILMKKGRCRGPDCLRPSIHFTVSVPGYDTNTTLFGRNECGRRPGTLFNSSRQSMLNGAWNKTFSSTAHAENVGRCDQLPSEFIAGCKLFSLWGWRSSGPSNVRFRTIACPSNFSAWVGRQFSSQGAAPLPGHWYGNRLALTHFWDCNGMGCDSTVLKPVNYNFAEDLYIAAPGYAPQDPEMHGGSAYGEQIWLVGAASDALANLLGPADACCGLDHASPGCGKCLLIQDPDAVQGNWTAVVMKKSRCPPESHGCEWPNVHLDLAVPGFDVLEYSQSNVCSIKRDTLFKSQSESAALGKWYECPNCALSDYSIRSRCEFLPPEYIKPCQLFADWGWRGSPKNVRFRAVECPSRFSSWVSQVFGPSGVNSSLSWPRITTTTSITTTSKSIITTSTTTSITTTNHAAIQTFGIASVEPLRSSEQQEPSKQEPSGRGDMPPAALAFVVLGGICLLSTGVAFLCMNALHCKLCGKREDSKQWPEASNRQTPVSTGTRHSNSDFAAPSHSTSTQFTAQQSKGIRHTSHTLPHDSLHGSPENLEFDL